VALGEKLGVSRQTIIALENGKYDPSLKLAFSLAKVFKRRIEDIFTCEE
jgi:putative transcriptional regulator